MVPERDGFEAGLEPFKGIRRMRPAVDQVSHSKQAVAGGIKRDFTESAFKGTETSVHITYDDVASSSRRIGGDERRYHGLRTWFRTERSMPQPRA